MLKKIITLSIVTAVVLIGVENLIAQEQTDTPRQQQRRRQGQEGRPGQRGQAQQFSGQREKDSESRAKRTEAMRKRQEAAGKKTEAMQQKRQQETAQKGAPQGRMGRSRQSRPWRNQPLQRMTGRRSQRLKGRGISGWNRRFQSTGLCPYCQRVIGGMGQGFQGRGMMGRGGQGFRGRGMIGRGGRDFQGRGMMGRGGQGFQGRGMMGRGGPGFRGRGMMGQGGQGFQGRGMMGGQGPGMPLTPDVKPFPWESPKEDVLRPAPPMQRRGMGRPDSNMPSPPELPMRGRSMGRRGDEDFPWPGGPESKPDNN